MATACSLLSRLRAISFPASRTLAKHAFSTRPSPITVFRPLICAGEALRLSSHYRVASGRCFSTRSTTSSIQDPSPNWSNRPPKETILLDGCDFEHWLVVVEKPDESLTRDQIIDSYIKTLAQVVGSEDEARMKIYSVSTKHYFAFGALVSEELSYKLKALPGVRWVLPDSYLDVRNKDYGGEPFIDGQAVPYDPKYHEEWVRNNARANERSRRQDRPRNNDRSRNFDRRRENMQSRDFQPREAPPMPNFQNAAPLSQPGQGEPPQSTFPQTPPNQMPNPQPGQGFQSVPPGQGYQAGPPGGGSPGYPAGPPGGGGSAYQAGPPGGGPGYPAGPPGGGQGYQAGPPGGGPGYQAGPPSGGPGYQAGQPGGGPGYQAGPLGGGQGYQARPPAGQGYQAGPPGGQRYPGGPPGGQGYQAGPPGGQGYQAGPPGPPGGQGYQAGPPINQGYQAGPPINQGYQAGPPGGQGYQSVPSSGQGYQFTPPGGQGYQPGPPGGQGYQPRPIGGQAYPSGQGYQAGPPRSQGYPAGGQPSSSDSIHATNQVSQGGPASGPPNTLNGNPAEQSNLGGYQQGGGNTGFQSGNANPSNQARDIPGRDI